jgi:hypothetical protein
LSIAIWEIVAGELPLERQNWDGWGDDFPVWREVEMNQTQTGSQRLVLQLGTDGKAYGDLSLFS